MNDFQERLYLIFAGIFIASLVACNLIFQKFFTWNFLGLTFELSVGIIAYPVTFLVTDLISELYGKKRANQVVISGFCASVFTTLLIFISMNATAAEWSPVDSSTFNKVFGLSAPAFLASMMAYLTAQFIDVRIFHFWKRVTKGKHLWLRNNASTMFSQLVDTSMVLLILCSAGAISWERFGSLLLMGWLFKVIVALIDTPIIYFLLWILRDKIRPANYLE
ncbi:MAG: queuosine precursor transporter [Candidatus Marinimicrobia bacterium]|nr:queuosine precursor transporter [Candidatus Neomarinimicrobiota bacterium]MDA1363371.1 queuosine precursor transporter [Candidatus Neomarinimicrobiota bacterium]